MPSDPLFVGAESFWRRLQHLDLLYGARRLWRLRYDSCRLVDLENQVLGVERQGDLPGALIPYVYFEYLHTKQATGLSRSSITTRRTSSRWLV